jgi:Cu2+-exporting ATPase
LRSDAPEAIRAFESLGLRTQLLSGDTALRVAEVAARLGIADWHSDQRPLDKIATLERAQASAAPALMVGDGINDAPVLGCAAVSAAMGQGADLAKAHADLILLGQRLCALPQAVTLARRTLQTIEQNLRWSYGYNAIAIPAAALGWVPPWLAAIGMSVSSLIVVWNSMRLARSAVVPPATGRSSAETAPTTILERSV